MNFNEIAVIFAQVYFYFYRNIFFWFVVLLVAMQYKRTTRFEKGFFGREKYLPWQHTLLSTLFGLGGGLFASILMLLLGISLWEIGILYVWPLAVLLLMVNPRYLCFAYAGGLVAAFSALLRIMGGYWPGLIEGPLQGIASIHIPGLLALIGVLHLTESILIGFSGHLFTSPLFLKTEKGVVGGFSLHKFWPLPLVGVFANLYPELSDQVIQGAAMPQWWPLLSSTVAPGQGEALVYTLVPVVAGLGYSEFAISSSPRQKSRISAYNLTVYSVLLIGAAFLAYYYPAASIPAALFSPLGHEFLIIQSNKRELAGKPLYVPVARGAKVLDVFPGTPAAAAGIASGDIILEADGHTIESRSWLSGYLRGPRPSNISLLVEREGQELEFSLYLKPLTVAGIVLVPEDNQEGFVEVKKVKFLPSLKQKISRLVGGNRKEQ